VTTIPDELPDPPDPRSELDDDELEVYDALLGADSSLRGDAMALLASVDTDPPFRFGIAMARADTRPWFTRWFTSVLEGPDWEADMDRSGSLGSPQQELAVRSVAVSWRFQGVHDVDGAFLELPATGRPVTIRGVSMLGVEDDTFMIRRYIDWAGLYTQLGLTLNWRVPIVATPPPG
jgi:hypothetical protein